MQAFLRYPDGRVAQCADLGKAHDAWHREQALLWLDLQDPSPELMAKTGGMFHLEDEAVEDCLTGNQRPRLDNLGDGIFLLLYGVLAPDAPPAFQPHKIAFFVGERLLITVGREASRTINRLQARYAAVPEERLKRGLGHLLYTLIDGLTDNYILCAEYYEELADKLEEASLSEGPVPDFRHREAALRSDLIAFRRMIVSQREAIVPLAQGDYDELLPDLSRRFSHLLHHMTTALELVDGLREVLHGARESHQARLTEATNSMVRSLSLVATVMMPPTLIAGIYGMNMPLWPREQTHMTFWYVVGTMAVVVVAMYIYFRRNQFR